jgi:hypothetical protein
MKNISKIWLALPLLGLLITVSAITTASNVNAATPYATVTCNKDSDSARRIIVIKKDSAETRFTTDSKCKDLDLSGATTEKDLTKTQYEALIDKISPTHEMSGAGDPDNTTSESTSACTEKAFLAYPTWYRGLRCKKNNGVEHVVIGRGEDKIPKTIWTVVLNVLDILIQTAGILAVVFLMYNGFQYLTSGGSADKISKAKTGMLQSVVGLTIAVLASVIISFIVGRIL